MARRPLLPIAILVLALAVAPAWARHEPSTFSIVAYDSLTHEWGVAVQSKYFDVGRVVPWAEAGVGAIATQASVNPSFGVQGLALLRNGLAPDQVLRALAANDSAGWSARQVGIVDARGRAASYTGPKCMTWAGSETGEGFACQGNILAGPAVVADMARAFRGTEGELAHRLIAALEAAQRAGGDKRGMQSAALLVVRPSDTHPEYAQRYIHLEVEDHKNPIAELRRVWQIHEGFHSAGAHLDYAAEYERAGQLELAQLERSRVGETMRRALARGERDASMLNGLAWVCATNGIFLDLASQAAARAAQLEPRSTDILDTQAEVEFRAGREARAIEIETRASLLDPKNQYLKDQIARFRGAKPAGK